MSMTGAQIFDWLVSVVNFGVMFLLFRLVVIVPMQEAVKLREQRVKLRLAEIDEIAADAKATKAEFEARFGEVDKVLADVKAASDRTLSQTKQSLAEKAESEERYILGKAKAEAESIRREAQATVRARLAADAISKAEASLKERLDSAAQNKILMASVKKMGELSAT